MVEYSDFGNIFTKELAVKLLEYLSINRNIIYLEISNQLLYRLIYSLKLIKLEILKTYTKIYLVNDFICLLKSSAEVSILFIKESNSSFCL